MESDVVDLDFMDVGHEGVIRFLLSSSFWDFRRCKAAFRFFFCTSSIFSKAILIRVCFLTSDMLRALSFFVFTVPPGGDFVLCFFATSFEEVYARLIFVLRLERTRLILSVLPLHGGRVFFCGNTAWRLCW